MTSLPMARLAACRGFSAAAETRQPLRPRSPRVRHVSKCVKGSIPSPSLFTGWKCTSLEVAEKPRASGGRKRLQARAGSAPLCRNSHRCRAAGRDSGLGAEVEEARERILAQNGSATSAGRGGVEAEEEGGKDSTYCMLSGEFVEDPDKEAEATQERVIQQLRYAQVIFPVLALARTIDALPGLLGNEGNAYSEIVTLVSAVDPLLVGIFAYGTASALQQMLERERRNEESCDTMRRKAMESLVNFFERANLVVFGVALASFSRMLLESAAQSDQWAEVEAKVLEFADHGIDILEVLTAMIDARI